MSCLWVNVRLKRNWWTKVVTYLLALFIWLGLLTREGAKLAGVRLLSRNIKISPVGWSDHGN